jgi:hypothetical protein
MEWEEEVMVSTTETMKKLAEPFPDAVVKQKPGRGNSRPLSYISHALVTERLNDVDPGWSWRTVNEHVYFDAGNVPHCAGVTVEMTVNGVSRVEAGGPQRQDGFANEIKNAYSDAIKRAAMRFGVALYIWDNLVDSQDDEDAQPAAPPREMTPEQRERVDAQHQRNTQPPPSSLPITRSPAGQRHGGQQQPDGQDRARQNIEAKCAARGIPVLPVDTYEVIAETVNRALLNAGKDIEVQTDRNGKVTPGAILNALMALPSAVPA